MRVVSRQRSVETKVEESIDEIADRLGLNVPFYPEVYWMGRKLDFSSLFLPQSCRQDFDNSRIMRASFLVPSLNVILIGNDSWIDASEEGGHFLHKVISGFSYSRKSIRDLLALRIIDEALAFFCSKLVVPERVNYHAEYEEYAQISEAERTQLFKHLKSRYPRFDLFDFNLYQQGYGLGEKMFEAYASGKLSMQFVRKLFCAKFRKPREPANTFIRLRQEFG